MTRFKIGFWLLLLAAVLVIPFEQALSESLYEPNDVVASWVSSLAYVPGYFFFLYAWFMLLKYAMARYKNLLRVLQGVGMVGAFALMALMSIKLIDYLEHPPLVLSILITAMVGGAFRLSRVTYVDAGADGARMGFHMLLTFVCTLFAVYGLKILWARPRPFLVMAENDTVFRPWFLPGGISDLNAFHAFPSGHTAITALWVVSLTLSGLLDGPSFHKKALKALLWLWLVLVALSRVVMGEHYMSDTLMAVVIVLGLFWLTRPVVNKVFSRFFV